MKRILASLAALVFSGVAYAQAPSPASMGLYKTTSVGNLSVLDKTNAWVPIGSVNSTTHTFTPFGTGTVTSSGSITPGNCAQFTTSTNIADAGAPCGTGGGGGITSNVTTTSGFVNKQMFYSDGSKVQTVTLGAGLALGTSGGATPVPTLVANSTATSGYASGKFIFSDGSKIQVGTFGSGLTFSGGTLTTTTSAGTINTGTVGQIAYYSAPNTLNGVSTVPVAAGGTGTPTPTIIAGTGITVSGSWPGQTISATASAPILTAGTTATSGYSAGQLLGSTGSLLSAITISTGLNLTGTTLTATASAPVITASVTATSSFTAGQFLYSDGSVVKPATIGTGLDLTTGVLTATASAPVLTAGTTATSGYSAGQLLGSTGSVLSAITISTGLNLTGTTLTATAATLTASVTPTTSFTAGQFMYSDGTVLKPATIGTGLNLTTGVLTATASAPVITANTTATSGFSAGKFIYSDGSVTQAATIGSGLAFSGSTLTATATAPILTAGTTATSGYAANQLLASDGTKLAVIAAGTGITISGGTISSSASSTIAANSTPTSGFASGGIHQFIYSDGAGSPKVQGVTNIPASNGGSPVINAAEYGFVCDGSTRSGQATALQNAINAASVGGVVMLPTPSGDCLLDGGVTIVTSGVKLWGQGPAGVYGGTLGGTMLSTNQASGDVLTIGNSSQNTEDVEVAWLGFKSTVVRSSGTSAIHVLKTYSAHVHDIHFLDNFYRLIYVDGGTGSAPGYVNWIDHIHVDGNGGTPVTTGIEVGNPSSTSSTSAGYVQNLWMNNLELNGSISGDAIKVNNVGGLFMTDVTSEAAGYGLHVVPVTNQLVGIQCIMCSFDGSTHANIALDTSGGGKIEGSSFTGGFNNFAGGPTAVANGLGIYLHGGSSTTMNDINFTNMVVQVNSAAGVYIDGFVKNINFTGMNVFSNGYNDVAKWPGYFIGDHAKNITITGGSAGNIDPSGAKFSQRTGISVYTGGGDVDYVTVSGVDLTGNSSNSFCWTSSSSFPGNCTGTPPTHSSLAYLPDACITASLSLTASCSTSKVGFTASYPYLWQSGSFALMQLGSNSSINADGSNTVTLNGNSKLNVQSASGTVDISSSSGTCASVSNVLSTTCGIVVSGGDINQTNTSGKVGFASGNLYFAKSGGFNLVQIDSSSSLNSNGSNSVTLQGTTKLNLQSSSGTIDLISSSGTCASVGSILSTTCGLTVSGGDIAQTNTSGKVGFTGSYPYMYKSGGFNLMQLDSGSSINSDGSNSVTLTGSNNLFLTGGSSATLKSTGGSAFVIPSSGCTNTFSTGGQNSTCGAWTNTSDIRAKNKLGSFTPGLAEISQIHPINYTYNGQFGTAKSDTLVKSGFSAQELQKVIPTAVVTTHTEEYGDVLAVDDTPLVAALINSVNQLKARVEILEAR